MVLLYTRLLVLKHGLEPITYCSHHDPVVGRSRRVY